MNLHPSSWQLDEKAKHVSKLLMLNNVNVMNIQLKAGEVVAEHDSDREVLIIVRKGAVIFTVENEEILVTQENILHMSPKEKHSLQANEDSDIIVLQIKP